MHSHRRQARHLLRAAIGIAVATVSSGPVSLVTATQPPSLRAIRLPPISPAEAASPMVSAVLPAAKLPEIANQSMTAVVAPILVDSDESADPLVTIEDAPSATVPLADYQALLERVDKLESGWDDYQDELADEAAEKKKKSSLKFSGRVHLDNWYFTESDPGINYLETGNPLDDPENRWDFRRIRLELQGTVPNNMLFRTQIDFNNPSEPEMKDAYIGWDGLPNNQTLLLGNQKRPIGMDHLNSSRHNVFIERPLAVETFNEDARRLGLCMYGYSDNEVVNWRYGMFLLENISDDGRYRGDFTQGGLYGRVAASPWYDDISGGRGYYHCAIAGSANRTDGDGTIDQDQNSNESRFRTRPLARSDERWWNTNRILGAEYYEQLAVESALNIGALQITGEYFSNWVQRDPLGGFAGDDLMFHGGYIFASYFLTGEHIPLDRTSGTIDRVKPFENFFLVDRCGGGRGRGWGAWCVAARFDYLDLTDSDILGGRGWASTLGLNWYWTPYSKVQTNYIFGNIQDGGQGQASPNAPLLAGVGGDFQILGFRYMIDY